MKKYAVKHAANKIGSTISKPGAFIHDKVANVVDTGTIEMFLKAAVLLLLIIAMLFAIFPIENSFNVVTAIIGGLFLNALLSGLIDFFVPVLLNVILRLTAPFAYISNRSRENLYAETEIEYFIEMDKKNSKNGFYRAKYIGE